LYRYTYTNLVLLFCVLGGTGAFLDAWLMLIEKMVNPKTVMESTHQLPTKSSQAGFIPFDPIQYLITAQKVSTP